MKNCCKVTLLIQNGAVGGNGYNTPVQCIDPKVIKGAVQVSGFCKIGASCVFRCRERAFAEDACSNFWTVWNEASSGSVAHALFVAWNHVTWAGPAV
eukprot:2966914-Ditylum_brightwellii.AAC.1